MGCVKSCVKRGAAPVFVTGDKVLKIANPDSVTAHLGEKVQVTGQVSGDTVTVDKVEAAQ